MGDIIKIGSTVFVVKSPDITNLKTMPVINKQRPQQNQPVPSFVQNQEQQYFMQEEHKNDPPQNEPMEDEYARVQHHGVAAG